MPKQLREKNVIEKKPLPASSKKMRKKILSYFAFRIKFYDC